MKKHLLLAFFSSSVFLTSCVSSKVYKDLESQHAQLQDENRELSKDFDDLQTRNQKNEADLQRCKRI